MNLKTIKRRKVESSNIKSIGYEPSISTLVVKFHTGDLWSYKPITAQGFNAFMLSESKGKFFNQNIKNDPNIEASQIVDW